MVLLGLYLESKPSWDLLGPPRTSYAVRRGARSVNAWRYCESELLRQGAKLPYACLPVSPSLAANASLVSLQVSPSLAANVATSRREQAPHRRDPGISRIS